MMTNNKIVYKYRDWNVKYHRNILLKNQLYLASPKDFNDPFDCRINSNFSLLSPEEEYNYINELAISAFPEIEKRGLDLNQTIKDFERRLSERKKFQKFADDMLYQYQNESYAIFSCALKWNNILMWSHYANKHQGFCVGLWADKLKDFNIFGKLGEVTYRYDYPHIKPKKTKKDNEMMIESFIETHTKAKMWKYESEYRFMSNHFPKVLTIKDRVVNIPDNIFAEVNLGINIPEDHKITIKKICKKKNIPVFQTEKVDFKFKMKRLRVQ